MDEYTTFAHMIKTIHTSSTLNNLKNILHSYSSDAMIINIHHEINDVFQQELVGGLEPNANDVSGLFNGISTLSKKCDSAREIRDIGDAEFNLNLDVSSKVKARNLANSFINTNRGGDPADNTQFSSDNIDMI